MHTPGMLFVCAISAATAAQSSYNAAPLRAVLNEDARVVWIGDSFSTPWLGRVSGASLATWPIREWSTFTMGSGSSWFFVKFEEHVPLINIGAPNGYALFDSGPDAGTEHYYGMPLWRHRERYAEPGSPETLVQSIEYRRGILADSAVNGFASGNETLRLTPLVLETPAAYPSSTLRFAAPGSELEMTPGSAADPKPAGGSYMDLQAEPNGDWSFDVSDVGGGYTHLPGFTLARMDGSHRVPGLHWSYLADGSWSYSGFGEDTPRGSDTGPKTISTQQLTDWLVETSVDAQQPVFVFWYLAVEDIDQSTFAEQLLGMVEQAAQAGSQAGLAAVHQCFVLPHFHVVAGDDGDYLNPGRFEEKFQAAVALAQSRDDLSVLSIYHATDGVLFDGSPAANQWLIAQGLSDLYFGDRVIDVVNGDSKGVLLDTRGLHPSNDGAMVFSWVLGRMMIDACPADFAAPTGALDLQDINEFVSEFINGTYRADIAEPWGLLDLRDIDRFTQSFLGGCG